ncbi:MAG: sulfite exporter TauE/SafE family protein, partial [Alphaproteobacteria bacterium]
LREGRVDFGIVAFMGIPTMAGAFLGGFYAGLAPRAVLLVVVGVMSNWYGFKLLGVGGKDRPQDRSASEPAPGAQAALSGNPAPAPAGAVKPSPSRRLKEMGFGFAIGLFGGVVGLLLGQLRLPAMIHGLGLDPRMAAGTNLAIGFLAGMLGFLGHMLHLEVDWAVFAVIAPAAMAGAYLGARQTGKISPRALKRLMGVVMVVVALPLFWVAFTQG